MENNTGLENKNIQILNDSEETETINEYLKLKELNKKSESKSRYKANKRIQRSI